MSCSGLGSATLIVTSPRLPEVEYVTETLQGNAPLTAPETDRLQGGGPPSGMNTPLLDPLPEPPPLLDPPDPPPESNGGQLLSKPSSPSHHAMTLDLHSKHSAASDAGQLQLWPPKLYVVRSDEVPHASYERGDGPPHATCEQAEPLLWLLQAQTVISDSSVTARIEGRSGIPVTS
jgi:hypothetical protein